MSQDPLWLLTAMASSSHTLNRVVSELFVALKHDWNNSEGITSEEVKQLSDHDLLPQTTSNVAQQGILCKKPVY